MVTLTQLEYIVAVARTGNFRQAAKACFVTQPTLSMQIQKAEEELGVVLFDRSAQPIRPTPIGARVVEQASVVLRHAAQIGAIVDETKLSVAGDVRLGVIPTLAPYVLPLFLRRFCDAYPDVRLEVDETKTDDIVVALREGRMDIGLLATPLGEPRIEEHAIFVEPFYVYAAEGSALAGLAEVSDADLKRERVLLLTEGHCLRAQVARVCGLRDGRRARGDARFEFEGGSLETLCRLVEQGLGCTVIPHLARGSHVTRRGRVVPFSAPRPSREVSLCVHESFARRALLDALARTIRASLPAELRRRGAELHTVPVR